MNVAERLKNTMQRQRFYPTRVGDQIKWLINYYNKVGAQATALGLDATGTIADAKWLAYVLSAWRDNVRTFAQGATEYCQVLQYGLTGGSTFPTPAYVNVTPPAGVVPVGAGILTRLFKFVQTIKDAPLYTTVIGDELGIVGPPVPAGPDAPVFTLELGDGPFCQCVAVQFLKGTHEGVRIDCKRGNETEFTFLANDTTRPYVDARPLLVPGQPEVRQYRLQFWDKGEAVGLWSEAATMTVGPV